MVLAMIKTGMYMMRDAAIVGRLKEWLRDRADKRVLLALDDQQLQDIGLTREQVLAGDQSIEPRLTGDATPPPAKADLSRMWIPPIVTVAGLSLLFASMHGAIGSEMRALPSVADLPPGTVKVSPPVPGMGEHWANPKDLPLGPIYCVMDGKVICAEFMIQHEAFIKGQSFERLRLGMPAKLPAVDHLEVTFMPHGHEGFEVPHYDLHMYFVPPEARFPGHASR
jgi:uncharacterized protein YjiS (DUF1127 family)